jgi:hypothetical protein
MPMVTRPAWSAARESARPPWPPRRHGGTSASDDDLGLGSVSWFRHARRRIHATTMPPRGCRGTTLRTPAGVVRPGRRPSSRDYRRVENAIEPAFDDAAARDYRTRVADTSAVSMSVVRCASLKRRGTVVVLPPPSAHLSKAPFRSCRPLRARPSLGVSDAARHQVSAMRRDSTSQVWS